MPSGDGKHFEQVAQELTSPTGDDFMLAADISASNPTTGFYVVKQLKYSRFATAAQGALADTAVQPGDLATVATSGDYNDLANLPTLGTMAAEAAADYLTVANNLSDLANAGTARTNLGLTIGTDVQAFDQNLQDIADLSPGAGNDGQAIAWDNGAGAFALAAVAGLTVDTRDTILASSPSSDESAFSTDTNELFIYDQTNSQWYIAPLELYQENTTPDIGPYNADGLGPSDNAGLYPASADGPGVITDYLLANARLRGNSREEAGAIRYSSGVFQGYANGSWGDFVINFVFREDSDTGDYELEHQPVGLEWYYEVMSGNSNETGLDGLPLAQQYNASIGPYGTKLEVDGGTF